MIFHCILITFFQDNQQCTIVSIMQASFISLISGPPKSTMVVIHLKHIWVQKKSEYPLDCLYIQIQSSPAWQKLEVPQSPRSLFCRIFLSNNSLAGQQMGFWPAKQWFLPSGKEEQIPIKNGHL